jgi:hypothetical protein
MTDNQFNLVIRLGIFAAIVIYANVAAAMGS